MASYAEFIIKYPQYTNPAYTPADITNWLEEADLIFPAISSCLPQNVRLLASYYALRWLEDQDYCESPAPIVSIESKNDKITYSLAGKGNVLVNSTWGNKLVRLFKLHGCYHLIGTTTADKCGNCQC